MSTNKKLVFHCVNQSESLCAGGARLDHPGALTDSDLLSWNWSSHGDSSLTDSASLTNEYSEIIRQVTAAGDDDSGKHSEVVVEKAGGSVEVREEETQVGNSLLHITDTDNAALRTSHALNSDINHKMEKSNPFESSGSSSSNSDPEHVTEDQEILEMVLEYESKADQMINEEEYAEPVDSIINDNDRMLSHVQVEDNTNSEKKLENDEETKTKPRSKEKIDPPTGEPIISGPLQVCLSLGSEWKRRYLTIVDDCLYIWTSHK